MWVITRLETQRILKLDIYTKWNKTEFDSRIAIFCVYSPFIKLDFISSVCLLIRNLSREIFCLIFEYYLPNWIQYQGSLALPLPKKNPRCIIFLAYLLIPHWPNLMLTLSTFSPKNFTKCCANPFMKIPKLLVSNWIVSSKQCFCVRFYA